MYTCMHTLPLQTLKYFHPTTCKEEMHLFLTNQGHFSRPMLTPLPFHLPKYSFTFFFNNPHQKKYFVFKKITKT